MKTTPDSKKMTLLGVTVHLERSDLGWRASILCPPPGQVSGEATLELYRLCDTQHEAILRLWEIAESIHDPDTRFAARYAVSRFINRLLL